MNDAPSDRDALVDVNVSDNNVQLTNREVSNFNRPKIKAKADILSMLSAL